MRASGPRRHCSTPIGVRPRRDSLTDALEVDDEDERLVGPDARAGALRAVGEAGRDDQLAPAADLHALDALVPALDDLTLAERERERLAAVPRGVELLAGRPRVADVLHRRHLPGLDRRALADDEVLLEQRLRRVAARRRDAGLLGEIGGVLDVGQLSRRGLRRRGRRA